MVFILKTLSQLPYWALHGIAAALAWFLGTAIGYRRGVILQNLRNSFPDKHEAEIRRIHKAFIRHFADITVESIKHFSVSKAESHRRMIHENTELFEALHAQGRSVLIAGGHRNNWELYALTVAASIPHKSMAIYKRLSNPTMDEAMRSSRERFGLTMVPTREAKSWIATNIHQPLAVVMGFDQSPADPEKSWWTEFLHQETAWYYGLEQLARQHNMAVVFGHIHKLKRGWYKTTYELVTDSPLECPEGDVLRGCIDLLERDIIESPNEWLWSHRRWKHRRPDGQILHPRSQKIPTVP